MATIWHAARSPARRERTIGDISRSNSHSQINRQWRAYRSVEVVNQWTKPLTPLSPSDTAPIISYLETVANRAAEQSFHSKRSIKSGFMQARSRYSLVFSSNSSHGFYEEASLAISSDNHLLILAGRRYSSRLRRWTIGAHGAKVCCCLVSTVRTIQIVPQVISRVFSRCLILYMTCTSSVSRLSYTREWMLSRDDHQYRTERGIIVP